MTSKWTPEIRGAVIERIAAGVSLPDTAHALELRLSTLKGWLTRGRREGEGEYADFAQAVDAAREEAKNRPEPMDEAELLHVASIAARKGSVSAMKLLWEILCAERAPEEKPGPLEAVDELSEKRQASSERGEAP